jgi:Ni/Co efflux regulator RcnB
MRRHGTSKAFGALSKHKGNSIMKNALFSAVAIVALFSPLSFAAAQQGRDNRGGQSQQYQRHNPSAQDQNNDPRRGEAGDHRNRREAWRDSRSGAQWDESQYNGYYDNNRWTYGPPPAGQRHSASFALGYQPWARGQRLGYYNNRFAEVNYRTENLRRPARGYRWVRDDRGDFLLAAAVSGLIAEVVVNGRGYSDGRQELRDNRSEARWNGNQNNGYYQHNTWHYGPPSAALYGQPGFALGYRPWVSGQRLGYYNGRYSEVNYRERNLREPPRGYHWVRDDRGDLLLAAVVGGLIAQVIVNNGN